MYVLHLFRGKGPMAWLELCSCPPQGDYFSHQHSPTKSRLLKHVFVLGFAMRFADPMVALAVVENPSPLLAKVLVDGAIDMSPPPFQLVCAFLEIVAMALEMVMVV